MFERRDDVISLVTDSSADLPKEIIERYDISVVPLNVLINGKEYVEGVDISAEEFCEMMINSEELPKTSQPSPEVFKKHFENLSKEGPVLCLTISSQLSGTYQSACLASDMADADVTVFDTLAGSMGHGLQLMEAGRLIEEGLSMEEVVEKLKEFRSRSNILILLDTLENIVKGGRASKYAGAVTEILNIKVLLEGIDGKVEMIEKVRGTKKFTNRVLEVIGERKSDFSDTVFAITHVNNQKGAEKLRDLIMEKYKPKDIIINYMGATMGTYAGKDGMIVSFY